MWVQYKKELGGGEGNCRQFTVIFNVNYCRVLENGI